MTRVEHRSEKHDWETPECVLDLVRKVGPIGLDPATTRENPTGARRWIALPDDGLAQPWDALLDCEGRDGELVYVNPPFGRGIGEWVAKCASHGDDIAIILLTPARTDTAWWELTRAAHARCLWRGRMTFKGAPAPAPFPSALLYWGPRPHRFADVFQDYGAVTVRGGL